MTGEQRLLKAFEMSSFTEAIFTEGLRKRSSHLAEEEFHTLYLERLSLCYNKNC